MTLLIDGCNSPKPEQANVTAKQKTENSRLASIFKPLDGTWEGKFYIYEDTLGQREGDAQPKNISYKYLKSLPLKLKSVIEAKHVYVSETPFLQKEVITDTYISEDGTKKEVTSTATNKVENGNLMCIVTKPNETVIHQGEYLGNDTIVWHRSIRKPKRIEYFYETVDSLHYKIIGWGYYGNDDPNLTPRTWFYADYKKNVGRSAASTPKTKM